MHALYYTVEAKVKYQTKTPYSPSCGVGNSLYCLGETTPYQSKNPFAALVLSLWNVMRILLKDEVTCPGTESPQNVPKSAEESANQTSHN